MKKSELRKIIAEEIQNLNELDIGMKSDIKPRTPVIFILRGKRTSGYIVKSEGSNPKGAWYLVVDDFGKNFATLKPGKKAKYDVTFEIQ